MKVFYCSTCFECYYTHPQELVTVCGCTALFGCVLVYWCGSAGVGWYPNAGWSTILRSWWLYVGVLFCNDWCLCISVLFVVECLFVCLLVAGVLLLCARIVCTCIQQQNTSRAHNNNTPATNKHTNKHAPTNKPLIHKHLSLQSSTPTYSRRLLRMNVMTFETCWAIKNFHKVTSGWFNLFNEISNC